MTADLIGDVGFLAHVQLLRLFIHRRAVVVGAIRPLVHGVHRSPVGPGDRARLGQLVDDCFFASGGLTFDQARLRGALQRAHHANGFVPRPMPEVHNDLVDPADMLIRASTLWQVAGAASVQARERFAETLYNLYLLRSLELLSLRTFDAGPNGGSERLQEVQRILDALWAGSPADQPVLIRDARWLIAVAQSPTTDELEPYFRVAQQVDDCLDEADRLEVRRATVLLAGGHLRSQLRHYQMRGAQLDDEVIVLRSRRSSALDFAMTMQGLVPLLQAYEHATSSAPDEPRLDLASAIFQGISVDPELFITNVPLLGPYTIVEPLFVITGTDGRASWTDIGERHLRLLRQYDEALARVVPQLRLDCARLRPVADTYSPLGVLYGFSSNITEHMAMRTLLRDPPPRFSLEDAFSDGDAGSGKLEWVAGWRQLPHARPDILKRFEYPQAFAEQIHDRIESALSRYALGSSRKSGRLYIGPSAATSIAPLSREFVLSSDPELVHEGMAVARDAAAMSRDRQEGEFAVSFERPGGWVAISKDFLTLVLGRGEDARIDVLPQEAADRLRLVLLRLAA